MTHPNQLTIYLLGQFALYSDQQRVVGVDTPRLQALIAQLALQPTLTHARRHLAAMLWPDSAEEQALTNLRKQILYLREALPAADQLLIADRHALRWAAPDHVHSDVAEFRALLAAAKSADQPQAIDHYQRAVALYKGDLLPGCYDEWVLPQREAVQQQYITALENLSSLLETHRRYAEAIHCCQQMLHQDPLQEATYRRLLRLYALNGDRAAALRTYHTCVTQLRDELGIDPDAETQAVYERLLHGTTVATTQPELAADAPFVSRQAEWQTLQQRWRLAQRGQPQLVLIAGEAGIGKTRLAEELLHWATHQGFCTARARCYAAEGRLTYAPVIEWLRAERLRAARSQVETTWLTELARLLPEILQEAPTVRPPEPITQSWQRHHLFEAISRALLALDQPLVLLIDDLQWCDKETLELLHFLLRHAATHGQSHLLLVGTARLPDEVATTHPLYELLNPLRGSDTLAQLDLARLTEAETAALAHQMVDQPLDDLTVQQLFRDTAGNPLFVVETIRATQGRLTRNGSADEFRPAIKSIDESEAIIQHLPLKVLAVIQARLGQLSVVARELCEWAAIVGRAFTLDLLVASSGIPQDKAVNALDELWQRRIIREQGSHAYDFSHDRIRDVAAAGVSRVRRRHLHQSIAQALEGQDTEPLVRVAGQIAVHYDIAGMLEKAITYYELAATAGLQIYANQDAITYLNRALALLRTQSWSRSRAESEYHLLSMLGPPLIAVQGYGSDLVHEHCLAAYKLAETLHYPPNPAILRIVAIYYVARRKLDLAHTYGMELLQIAQTEAQRAEPLIYSEGCYTLGVVYFWQGRFLQARQQLALGFSAYDQQHHAQHTTRYGQDPGVICLSRLAWTLWYLGYPEQALQYSRQALDLANVLDHPFSIGYALMFMQWLCMDMRNERVLAEIAELALVYQKRFDFQPANQALEVVCRGQKLVMNGHVKEGIELISAGITMAARNQYELMFKLHFRAILAQAQMGAGNWEQAHHAIQEALDHIATYHDGYYAAELYRLQGELLLAQSKPYPMIESCFLQSLTIAREQQAKSLELRTAMSLSRLWAQQGKRTDARALLDEVYNWFTEGFDTPDVQEAQSLLASLTGMA